MAQYCRAFVLLMLSLSCLTLAEDDEYHHVTTGVPSHTPFDDLEDLTNFPTTEYTADDATRPDDHTGTPEPCTNKTASPCPPVKVIAEVSYKGTTEDQFETMGAEDGVSLSTLTSASDDTGHEAVTVPSTPLDIDDQPTEVSLAASTQTVGYLPAKNFYDLITTITRRSNYLKSTKTPVRYFGRQSYETTVDHKPDDHYEVHVSETTPADITTEVDNLPKTEGYTGVSMTPLDAEEDTTTVTGHVTRTEYADETTDVLSTMHYKDVGRDYEGPVYMTTTTKAPVQYYGRLSYKTTMDPKPDDHHEDQATETTPAVSTEDEVEVTDGHTGVSMTPLDNEDDVATVTGHSTTVDDYDGSTDGPSTTYYESVGRDSYKGPVYTTKKPVYATPPKSPPVRYYGRLAQPTTMNYVPDDHYEDQATQTTPDTATERVEFARTMGYTGASETLDVEDDSVTVTGHSNIVDDHDQPTDVPSTTYNSVDGDSYEGRMYRTTTTKAPVRYYGRQVYKTTMDVNPDDHHEDEATETTTVSVTEQNEAEGTEGHTRASMTPLDAEEDITTVTGRATRTEYAEETTDVPSTVHYTPLGRDSYEDPVYFTTTTKAPVRYYGRLAQHTTIDYIPDDHHEHQGTETTPDSTTEQVELARTAGYTDASVTPLDVEYDTVKVTGHSTTVEHHDQFTFTSTTYKSVGRDSYEGPMYMTTTTKPPLQYYGRLVHHTTEDSKPDDHYEDEATETTPGFTAEHDEPGITNGRTGFSMTPVDAEDDSPTVTGHSTTTEHHDQYTEVPSSTYKSVEHESYEDPMYMTTTKAPPQKYGRRYHRTTMNLEYVDLGDHQQESTTDLTMTPEGTSQTEHATKVSMTPSEVEDSSISTVIASTDIQPRAIEAITMTSADTSPFPEREDLYVDVTTRKYKNRRRKTRRPTRYHGRMHQMTTMMPEDQYAREADFKSTMYSSTVEPLEDLHSNPSTMMPDSTSDEFEPSNTPRTISSLPDDDQDSTDYTQTVFHTTEHPIYNDEHPYDTTPNQRHHVKTTKTPPVRHYGRLSQTTMIPPESIYEHHEEDPSTIPSATPDSTESVSHASSTILEDSTHDQEPSHTTPGTTTLFEEESSTDETTYKTKEPGHPYSPITGYKTKNVPVVYRQRKFYQSTVIPDYHSITNDIQDSTKTYQTEDHTDVLESSQSTITSDHPQNPDALVTGTSNPTSTEDDAYDHGHFHGTTIPIRKKSKGRYHHATEFPEDLGREIHIERSGHWTPSEITDYTEEPEDELLATSDASVTDEDPDDSASATSTTLDTNSEEVTDSTMTTEEQSQGYETDSDEDSQVPYITQKPKYVKTEKPPVPVRVYGRMSQDNATILPEPHYKPKNGSSSTIHPSTEVPGTLPTTLNDTQNSTVTETLASLPSRHYANHSSTTNQTEAPVHHHGNASTEAPIRYYARLLESSTQVFQEGDDLEESSGENPTDEGGQSQSTEESDENHVTESMASTEEGFTTEEVPPEHEDFLLHTTMDYPVEYPVEYPDHYGYY